MLESSYHLGPRSRRQLGSRDVTRSVRKTISRTEDLARVVLPPASAKEVKRIKKIALEAVPYAFRTVN